MSQLNQLVLSNVCNKNVNSVSDYIMIVILLIYMSCGSFISSDNFITTLLFIFLFLYYLIKSKKNNYSFIVIFTIWLLINIISSIRNEVSEFNFFTFWGSTIRMILAPYFIFKCASIKFWDNFFKISYYLVIISSVFFLIDVLNPGLFSSIAKYINIFTADEQRMTGKGFYIFFYMHSGWGFESIRNCGFMWEPGAYAMMLIFLLHFYWFRKGFVFDKKVLIITLALISTFSTAGYFALFVVILFYCISLKNRNIVFSVIICFSVITTSFYMYNELDFLSSKIETYLLYDTSTWEHSSGITRMTRWGYAKVVFGDLLKWPWGNGINDSISVINKYGSIDGPGALSEICKQWGVWGMIGIPMVMYKFSRFFTRNLLLSISFLISMLIMLFSNPFAIRYLVFIMLYMIIFNNKVKNGRTKKNINNRVL